MVEGGLTVEKITAWLSMTIDRLIGIGNKCYFKLLSRDFLIAWSFIVSLVIRDLTLRSVKTFGAFHLLRLFMDEYILYMLDEVKRGLKMQMYGLLCREVMEGLMDRTVIEKGDKVEFSRVGILRNFSFRFQGRIRERQPEPCSYRDFFK